LIISLKILVNYKLLHINQTQMALVKFLLSKHSEFLDEEQAKAVAATVLSFLGGKGGKVKRAPLTNADGEVVKRVSGYNLFSADTRETVKEDDPDLPPKAIMTELGARWKALEPSERAEWNAKALAQNEANGITPGAKKTQTPAKKVAAKPAAKKAAAGGAKKVAAKPAGGAKKTAAKPAKKAAAKPAAKKPAPVDDDDSE